jgi:hypothetical protein
MHCGKLCGLDSTADAVGGKVTSAVSSLEAPAPLPSPCFLAGDHQGRDRMVRFLLTETSIDDAELGRDEEASGDCSSLRTEEGMVSSDRWRCGARPLLRLRRRRGGACVRLRDPRGNR